MKLFEELKWRGLVYDVTDPKIKDILENEKITFYMGADPTADSLHIGNLLQYVTARRLQDKGHKPIMLIGGATGLIGDPRPDASSERELLTLEQSLKNADAIYEQVSKMIDAERVNNYDWISKLDVITFLRDYGKYFNINNMINKDTVKKRLETGISYTEFSYQILQAIDWHHLYKEKNCVMQFGGQDQWGNITAGSELIRKLEGSEVDVFAMTTPLITDSSGKKIGKSTGGGGIWLDAKKTTPYEFYQYWLNTTDEDAVKFLKMFTFLTKEEIEDIEVKFKLAPHERAAQKHLAEEVTTMLHGKQALEGVLRITEALFNGDIKTLSGDEIENAFKDVPSVEIEQDINVVDLLIECNAASSRREAREFVSNGAITINGDKIIDLEYVIKKENAIDGKYVVVRRGKKNYYLIKFK